jgi:hypothetical protein
MSLENFFPYRPLERSDIDTLTEFCGGAPVIDPEQMQGFFKHLARPMIGNGLAKQLLVFGAEACTEIIETNPIRGKQMFDRGALLYAAVLAEFSPLSKVPCEPEVFLNIGDIEGEDILWATNDRLHDESPTFCSFMGEVSVALELFSPIDRRLAAAGAGLVHIMTTESLRPGESHFFELQHPELADLEPLFRELGE